MRTADTGAGGTPAPAALLLDLNGVPYDDDGLVDGAVETVAEARRRGLAIRFVTNTATRHHDSLRRELLAMGFRVKDGEPFPAPLEATRPDCVLLGDARDQLSDANLNRALALLLQGAPLRSVAAAPGSGADSRHQRPGRAAGQVTAPRQRGTEATGCDDHSVATATIWPTLRGR